MAWQTGTERRGMPGARGVIASGFNGPSDLTNLYAWNDSANVTGASPVTAWPENQGVSALDLTVIGNTTLDNSTGINSKSEPYLIFDGTGDVAYRSSITKTGTVFHCFLVMRVNTYAPQDVHLSIQGSGAGFKHGLQTNALGTSLAITDGDTIQDTANTPTAGNWCWVEMLLAGASSTIIVDNGSSQGATLNDPTLTQIILAARTTGGANAGVIDIAESIICDSQVTTQLADLRAWAAATYGVSTN